MSPEWPPTGLFWPWTPPSNARPARTQCKKIIIIIIIIIIVIIIIIDSQGLSYFSARDAM